MASAGGSAGGAGGASGSGDGSVETGLAKELLSRLQTPVWLYNVDEQRVVYANATASRLVHREDTGGGVHIIEDWPTRYGDARPTIQPAAFTSTHACPAHACPEYNRAGSAGRARGGTS